MAVLSGSSYDDALEAINTLIHRKPNSSPAPNGQINWAAHFKQTFKHLKVSHVPSELAVVADGILTNMTEARILDKFVFVFILELEEAVERLSIIHVAGTKGKGSTCAFTESILRASGFRTGLFTSPHLLDVCERFRFDGREVSREVFAENFWWCYRRLQANTDIVPMPGFFRFMTLLALRMFTVVPIDVVILEVGLGGRLDATNVVKAPAVCGIASLGFDHMDLLGNTLCEIAGEKAGIFKAGVPAITSPQPEEAMKALQKRAKELEISLTVAPPLESYGIPNLKLGLKGDHQRINAALAIALSRQWAQHSEHDEDWRMAAKAGALPESYVIGLANTRWPGRGEVVHDSLSLPLMNGNGQHKSGKLQFYLDGAHSPESMEVCARWFCDTMKAETFPYIFPSENGENPEGLQRAPVTRSYNDASFRRVLLFNCMPKRDPESLLPPLVNLCTQQGMPFHMAFFTPPISSYTSLSTHLDVEIKRDVSWQLTVQKSWECLWQSKLKAWGKELYTGLEEHKDFCHTLGLSSAVMSSLTGTLEWIRSCAKQHPQLQIQVLVTGSLYLVGDMLKLLKH